MRLGDKKLQDVINDSIKSTVGYSEVENKESFMVGANVAFSIAEKLYAPEIENLRRKMATYKSAYENTKKDLKTVSSIINRYADCD